jgi:hypothetical protein
MLVHTVLFHALIALIEVKMLFSGLWQVLGRRLAAKSK